MKSPSLEQTSSGESDEMNLTGGVTNYFWIDQSKFWGCFWPKLLPKTARREVCGVAVTSPLLWDCLMADWSLIAWCPVITSRSRCKKISTSLLSSPFPATSPFHLILKSSLHALYQRIFRFSMDPGSNASLRSDDYWLLCCRLCSGYYTSSRFVSITPHACSVSPYFPPFFSIFHSHFSVVGLLRYVSPHPPTKLPRLLALHNFILCGLSFFMLLGVLTQLISELQVIFLPSSLSLSINFLLYSSDLIILISLLLKTKGWYLLHWRCLRCSGEK